MGTVGEGRNAWLYCGALDACGLTFPAAGVEIEHQSLPEVTHFWGLGLKTLKRWMLIIFSF